MENKCLRTPFVVSGNLCDCIGMASGNLFKDCNFVCVVADFRFMSLGNCLVHGLGTWKDQHKAICRW